MLYDAFDQLALCQRDIKMLVRGNGQPSNGRTCSRTGNKKVI